MRDWCNGSAEVSKTSSRGSIPLSRANTFVAQRSEQLFYTQRAAGSIPAEGTRDPETDHQFGRSSKGSEALRYARPVQATDGKISSPSSGGVTHVIPPFSGVGLVSADSTNGCDPFRTGSNPVTHPNFG